MAKIKKFDTIIEMTERSLRESAKFADELFGTTKPQEIATNLFYRPAEKTRNKAYNAYFDAAYTGPTGRVVLNERDWKAAGSPTPEMFHADLEARKRVVVKTDDEGKPIEKAAGKRGRPRSTEPKPVKEIKLDEQGNIIKGKRGRPRLVVGPAKPRAQASGTRRIPAMIEDGTLKVGQVLHIGDSLATIIDGRTVNVSDKPMTFNGWGESVTGHKAVNIYIHAMTESGQFLNELR